MHAALCMLIMCAPCTHLTLGQPFQNNIHFTRRDDQRFLRLLEILGEFYEQGKVIVFVQSQDRADHLFRDLLRVRLHTVVVLQCMQHLSSDILLHVAHYCAC